MAAQSLFEVRLLGGIEVTGHDGVDAQRGSRKERALLAILALARGHAVSAERLVDELWGGEPPSQALASLYPYVSNLRRILEPGRDAPPSVLVTVPPGYALRLPDHALDIARFEHAAREVSTLVGQRRWTQVRERCEEALSWWRGRALEEFATEPFAELEAARLEELRLVLLEDLYEARVETDNAQVTADLERFVGAQPLRERGWGLLMRSLYAGGRQSDALRAYQRARLHLREELGVEPGPQLRELESSILRHDAHLDATAHRRTGMSTSSGEVDRRPDTVSPGSRIVGRDRELAVCWQVLDEITLGPRAIIAEGEPGIGKTRLVEEVADLAASRDVVVLWGRSLDGAATPAFWPWLPVLRRLAELDTAGPVLDPELESLLSPSSSGTETSPGPARFVLFDQIVALVERVAHRQPIMIALDDLQWADVASLELVVTLATRLSRPGALLAVTTRQLDVGRNDTHVAALAALTRMTGSRRLQLDGLDHAQTVELLSDLTGRPTDPTTAAVVLSRAEGNPFYTTEMGRLLTASTHDRDALSQTAVTIRDVIMRRLEPMPPATLELLRLASVIGREFSIVTVARTMQFADVLDCLEVLEPAVLQRLVIHVDTQPGMYRFTHGLLSDVLVGDQTAGQLAAAHLRIADALDHTDHTDDTAEILAEHLWAAAPLADTHRTTSQLERAALVAMARGAYEAAQDLLERAVELHHTASRPTDPDGRARALTLLASVSMFHRGHITHDESMMTMTPRRVGRLDPHDVTAVRLRYVEFIRHITACSFPGADAIADELRSVSEVTSDPLIRSIGNSAHGHTCWYHGRLTEAVTHLETALRSLDEATEVQPDRVSGHTVQLLFPAPILLHLRELVGDLDEPSSAVADVRQRLPNEPVWPVMVSLYASLGALMVGDYERAVAEGEVGVLSDPDLSFEIWSLGLRVCLVAARCARGDVIDGETILRMLDERYEAGTQRATMSIVLATLSIGLARTGQTASAAEAVTRARAEIDPHRDLSTEPIVLLAEAVGAADHEDHPHASRLLNRALVITERQGAHAVGAHIGRVARTLGYEMAPAQTR